MPVMEDLGRPQQIGTGSDEGEFSVASRGRSSALMPPYALMLPGLWTVLLTAWYLVGTPLSA